MMRCVACCGLFPAAAFALEADSDHLHVASIEDEPCHRQVLTSESLRVFDVSFPPGQSSLWHRHQKDSVMVCLEGGDVPSEEPGKAWVARPPIPPDHIYYRPYANRPFVHRIGNIGLSEFRILDIEVLTLQPRSTPLAGLGPSATVALQNERVRVFKFTVLPGALSEPLCARGPHLLIAMTDGNLRIEFPNSGRTSLPLPARRGSLHMQESEGKMAIRNIGPAPVEMVMLEIK